MQRLLVAWVDAAARHRWPVLLLTAVLTIVAVVHTARDLEINSSTTDLLSEALPFRQDYRAFERYFPELDDSLIVVVEGPTPGLAAEAAARLTDGLSAREGRFREIFYPDGSPFFRRNGLLYLELEEVEALAERLAEAQPLLAALTSDPSLRGLADVIGDAVEQDEQRIAVILERLAESVESVGAGSPRPLDWQAVISGSPSEEADRRKIITIHPVSDERSLMPLAGAQRDIEQAVAALGLAGPGGIAVRMTGADLMLQEELLSLRSGIGLAGLISITAVLAILLLGLRSWRLVLTVLLALLVGLSWTALFATVAVGELNVISVAFAVLFIGLGVDFAVHFILRYREALRGGALERAGLRLTAGSLGGPLLLCAISTAIGFFAFLPTSYRGVSQLGLISGVGMFIALFVSLTLIPALIALLGPHRVPAEVGRVPILHRATAAFQEACSRYHRSILLVALALALLAAVAVPFARFDDDPLNLRDPASPSVATLLDILDDPRIQPYEAYALAPNLEAAQTLAARLAILPEVAAVRTAADLVPDEQEEKLAVIEQAALFMTPVLLPGPRAEPPTRAEDWAALRRLHERLRAPGIGDADDLAAAAERLAEALAGLEIDSAAPDPARVDALRAALLAGLPYQLERLADSLRAAPVSLADLPDPLRDRWLAPDGPTRIAIEPERDLRDPAARDDFVAAVLGVAPDATGEPVIISAAGTAVIEAFREAGLYALILVSLLVLAVLRKLRDSLLVMTPLLLGGLFTVAATVLIDMPFNFANVIVLPVLLGLGIDSGIHLVTRTRERSRDLAASSTPRAVLISALTTIGSFGALALSPHRGTASMGQLLTVSIFLTLATTLIVLPALMRLCGLEVTRSRQDVAER